MTLPLLQRRGDLSEVGDSALGKLAVGVEVIAAGVEHGRLLLTTADAYVLQQSQFDRQARVGLREEVLRVTQAIYLDYVASQVMAWSPAEVEALRTIVATVASLFQPLALGLPPQIVLVKTTGQEEGYAAYTRNLNTIVLPVNMVASLGTATSYGDPLHPADDYSYLQNVLIHECFHLFSKNNAPRRLKLYSDIHYKSTGAPVDIPDVPWGKTGSESMRNLKITNPDEPTCDVYIEMDVPETPSDPKSPTVSRALMPLLLSTGPYQGGVFFEYLEWWFMAITQVESGQWEALRSPNGDPYMYESAPLLKQYTCLVTGNFSQEIFQPDEVLAQNFVLAANQPDLDVLSQLQRTVAANKAE